MHKPHLHTSSLLGALLICAPSFSVQAQTLRDTPDKVRSVQSSQQQSTDDARLDELKRAVETNKEDANAWHQLGVALNRAGQPKEARQAFQKAIDLRPDFAESFIGLAYTSLAINRVDDVGYAAHRALRLDATNAEALYILGVLSLRRGEYAAAIEKADAAVRAKPQLAAAHLLKFRSLLNATLPRFKQRNSEDATPTETELATKRAENRIRFADASASLEEYLRLSPKGADATGLREQLEAIRVYARNDSIPEAERTIFQSFEVDTRAEILSRPEPAYTEEARRNRVSGQITLRLVLAADGKVTHVLPLKSLSHGLTDKAMDAARAIRFRPAIKNGRPVSQAVLINYSFVVY